MTHIWYEVFPVTLVDNQPALLQSRTSPACSPWMLPHQSTAHPNAAVIDALATMLGLNMCNEKTIVHSTSWRYDAQHDWMLLTYLAVLPHTFWPISTQANSEIMLLPIGNVAAQYGDQLFPPEQIERQHVLAHALDHLASLNTYDPSIQAALEPAWQPLLCARQPKPAGCLQRSPLLAPSPALPASDFILHTENAQPAVLVAGT
jgi:hypothetical protein